MNFSSLTAFYARLRPARSHAAFPLAMMAGLFWLSSLPGVPLPDDPDRYALFLWISPTVQNLLHLPAFAVLGAAWRWALAAWSTRRGVAAFGALAISSGYGFVDEWRQSFVPGRFGSLTDVAADIVGAAIGAWLAGRAMRGRSDQPRRLRDA